MFCPKCGEQIPNDCVFCDKCGAKIDNGNENVQITETPVLKGANNPPPSPVIPQATSEIPGSAPNIQIPAPNIKEGKTGADNSKILYIASVLGVTVLIIGGFLGYKSFLGKGGTNPKVEEAVIMASGEKTVVAASESEPEMDDAAESSAESKGDDAAKENAETDAVQGASAKSSAEKTSESASKASTEIVYDEDYPEGFRDEVELTESEMKAFADRMSTTEYATAKDVDWFKDYVNNGGTGAGKFLTDENKVFIVVGYMQPVLNGGWKAYTFTKDGDYGSDYERYFNAVIDTSGNDFTITTTWNEVIDPVKGLFSDETQTIVYKGTFDPVTGKATAKTDDSRIDIDNFYSAMDIESEYAVGTIHWSSGETDQLALMREYTIP